MTDLQKPLGCIEVTEEVVLILDDGIHFVAQSEVHSESLVDAPVILDKACETPVVNVPRGIALQQAGVRGKAGKVIFDAEGQRAATQSELDSAPGASVSRALERVTMEFTAKLDGVTAADIGDVIDKLEARVRSLHLGPVKAPEFLREDVEVGDLNSGKSAVQRIDDAGVQAIGRGGNIVVGNHRGLVEAVIAEAGFIHPACIWDPGPVLSEDLRARVDIGEPLRLNLKCVGDRPGVVAEEVQGAEVVAIIVVIVDFANHIVDTHCVRQAVVDFGRARRICSVVGGKSHSIATYRVGRSEGAARNLKADCADTLDGVHTRSRDERGSVHIGDRIGDALGTVSCAAEHAVSRVRKRNRRPCVELTGVAHGVALTFISSEVKQLVLYDCAPGSSAELREIARVLHSGCRIKVIASVKRRVASEGIGCAVNLVGARLQADVHDCTRFPSIFCGRILLKVEFLNRVHGKNRGGVSGDAGAIDDALAREGFAVEQAVHQISVVFGSESVRAGGGESSARIANHAGTQLQQVLVVAPIQREVVDLLVAERAS